MFQSLHLNIVIFNNTLATVSNSEQHFRGKLNESLAKKYFHQLVSALTFCHQNGVAHRDVKPQNLLLDKNGCLKVSDFGLSALKQNGAALHLNTACGTPAFTAPEVFARKGYDGPKADAWSCGVVLFFLLTGKLPFDDGNLVKMCRKMKRRDYEIPFWVSRSAKAVIHSLLDPNPGTRMSLEGLISHYWFSNKCLERVDDTSSVTTLGLGNCGSGANAFDIISMSSGLDLSGLFVEGGRERKFMSAETVERVVEKVREVGGSLGYRVEKGKCGGAIGLGKGRVRLEFEILEIAERLLVVEVKVLIAGEGGGGVMEEFLWGELRDGLGDVALQWHN